MACPHLITCGDNVKIWDSSGYSLLHQFQPNNTKDDVVTDVSWSRDGGMVASVTSRQALLVVTGVTGDGTRQLSVADELAKPSCCRFCTSNSRYIGVGSLSGSVQLWDNKNGKLVKHYQGHKSPVTRVCFSSADRHVASGSRSGQVLVHNVTSGFVTELPTARTEPQCVRDLRYSTFPAAVVGAAFDTGHVSLWDVNQRRLLHTFTGGHVAPAAGIAFSPVNDILLASVGLDKRLVCYDPKSKSVIQTVTGDAPLTALDFHGDGTQLAVGTSQGRVCVYDLRVPRKPSRSFTAHRSSVQRVQFQPPARGQTRSSSSHASSRELRPAGSSREHARSLEESSATPAAGRCSAAAGGRTHSTPNEEGRPGTADGSHGRFGHVSAEQSSLFSPIRDEPGHKLGSPPPPPPEATLNGTAHGVSHHGRDSSVFSPVRGDLSLAGGGPAGGASGDSPPERPPPPADSSLFSPLRPDRSALPEPPPPPLLNGISGLSLGDAGLSLRDAGVETAAAVAEPTPRLNGAARPAPEQDGLPAPLAPASVLTVAAQVCRPGPEQDGLPAPLAPAPAPASVLTVAAQVCRPGPEQDGLPAPLAPAPAPASVLTVAAQVCRPGPDGAAPGAAGDSSDRLRAALDAPPEGERRRQALAELAFGAPQQQDKLPEMPPQAHTAEPVPHSVVEKLEGLQERMDDMWWGLRRENFNTQWSVGKHMYEMKASMEGMASTIEGLKSEVQRLREENQYLGCKF